MINKIPHDKYKHGLIGLLVFIVFGYLLTIFNYHKGWALIISLCVGIGIEVYQKITKSGKFEGRDILATFGGGLIGYLASGI